VTERRRVLHVDGDRRSERPDSLAVEEPLEIRLNGSPLAVTMRTPGHDLQLALGFLFTEGILRPGADVPIATACGDNVVDVRTGAATPPAANRSFVVTSSCGVCGKDSVDAVRTSSSYDVSRDQTVVTTDVLVGLPAALRAGQRAFDRTGGLHAAGLFTPTGGTLCVREDVGRHNAVDKVVGWGVEQERLPLIGSVLQVSGRASFELVQKAVMAGIPVLSAVSAPSSLAVSLAEEAGLTLVGFLRGASFNVYAGAARLTDAATSPGT
jgi:FdhD protein